MTVRLAIAIACAFVVAACASKPPAAPPQATSFEACALLAPADVKDVQGEEPVETKPSEQVDGAIVVRHCFYRLADFSKSISLSAGTVGRAYWERMFAGRPDEEEEEEREREGKRDVRVRIRRLGDEAFWLPSPVGGTLYVRQGDNMLRIAMGGKSSDADRRAKVVTLARHALPRLPK